MNAIDAAWAAGLYEGEGSITFSDKNNSASLVVSMTDLDALERFMHIMGTGKIYGPYQYKNNKPIWRYTVTKQNDLRYVCSVVLPYLMVRRRAQIETVLAALRPLGSRKPGNANMYKTHCKWGHEFTEENTYLTPTGSRQCRECRRIDRRRRRQCA